MGNGQEKVHSAVKLLCYGRIKMCLDSDYNLQTPDYRLKSPGSTTYGLQNHPQ